MKNGFLSSSHEFGNHLIGKAILGARLGSAGIPRATPLGVPWNVRHLAEQNYDPAGNIWLSALVACLPILLFFLSLTVLRLKGWLAGTLAVLAALAVALFFYGVPAGQALASAVYGFFYGLWPIAWIIIGAVFLYKIAVRTSQVGTIRESVLSLAADQRLQMLLVGFAFGSFLGRRGRLRRARGHHGGAAGGAGLPPPVRRRPVPGWPTRRRWPSAPWGSPSSWPAR